MTVDVSIDVGLLKSEIKKTYSSVSEEPERDFIFPTGRAWMFRSAWGLLRDSGRVLLEAAPEGMNAEAIGRAIATYPHVESVHDLHVLQISSGFPALSAHVLVHQGDDCHAIRRELGQLLDERFHIEHTTLQVDHAPDRHLVQIGQAQPCRREH
jgi:divalent metal cation (Fe/Co/Zn/Cd) transporter